jgi:tripartite-type tricarboxylate transporter receptor subunit TctC
MDLMRKICRIALLFMFFAATDSSARAQNGTDRYPIRPIRLVVGFTAGGPTDIPARFIAQKLSTSLGGRVVVENKPGAGGMVAAIDVFHKTDSKGYDLLVCTYNDAVNTVLYKSAKYTLSDIQPISLISRFSYPIAVAKSLPVSNIHELISYAKAHPNEVNYGILGPGSTQVLIEKRLQIQTGMSMFEIPFKGTTEAMQELLTGRIQVFVGPPIGLYPFYKAGQIKVIASTGDSRLPSMPEVPTLTEQGIPLVAQAWLGICAARETPKSVVDMLNRKIAEVTRLPEYKDLTEKTGTIPASSTPAELGKIISDSANDNIEIIRRFNLQVD